MGKGGPVATQQQGGGLGLKSYYKGKIEELEMLVKDKSHNLRRLEAQRNELNTQGVVGCGCAVHVWVWVRGVCGCAACRRASSMRTRTTIPRVRQLLEPRCIGTGGACG
jgi:hypothetical protein